jgi:hypothetical protein
MDLRPADTTPEAWEVYLAALRRIGPEGRLRMAMELSDNARAITEAGIRQSHPDWGERRVRLELIRIVLGPRLFERWYTPEA